MTETHDAAVRHGLGRGARLASPADAELVAGCVRTDHRWDRQVDE